MNCRRHEIDLTGTHAAHDAYVSDLDRRMFYRELASAISSCTARPTWTLSWDEETGEYKIEVDEGG